MKLLLFRRWRDEAGLDIESRVRSRFPDLAIEHYSALESLVARLRQPCTPSFVAALLIAVNPGDVRDLAAWSPLFDGMKVLLVLPDEDAATVANGHRLKPSLMTCDDGGPAQICAVIERLLERRLSDVA